MELRLQDAQELNRDLRRSTASGKGRCRLHTSPARRPRPSPFPVSVLKDIDSITQRLPDRSITFADARALLDGVVNRLPSILTVKDRLGSKAYTVENPVFEAVLVRVQKGLEHRLSPSEKRSFQYLLRPTTETPTRKKPDKDPADELLKRPKCVQAAKCLIYINTKFIVPTSTICEPLSSVAGVAMGTRRKGMSPSRFEEQMLFSVNHALWDICDVQAILQ